MKSAAIPDGGLTASAASVPTGAVARGPEIHHHARRHGLLTQGTPSFTQTIADAVVMKDGDLFLLAEPDGSMPSGEEHGLGLYYHDCRYLRTYEIRLSGVLPVGLGSASSAGHCAVFQLTSPDLRASEGGGIARAQLGIAWERALEGNALALIDTIRLANWGREPIATTLDFRFDSRFEDVFEVRGLLHEELGTRHPPEWDAGCLRFTYDGKDGCRRSLTIELPEGTTPTGDTTASVAVGLEPRGRATVQLRLVLGESHGDGAASTARPLRAPVAAPRGIHTRQNPASGGRTSVRTDGMLLGRALQRSFADLQLLRSSIDGHTFVSAGVPWFCTLFGRDSLLASLQLLPYDAHLAASTLRLLATYQGDRIDQWRDEEPGKILHELRVGEMARSGEVPHSPYYGTIDATPLFLLLLARQASWTGDLALFAELRANVERALEWIGTYGDADDDGYLEYRSSSEHGLVNQGWKDSGDAIMEESGAIAEPPIALVEVQAYVYAAKTELAGLFERAGEQPRAESLRREAAELRMRFNRDYWLDQLGCYALALESAKRPLGVVTSNGGHALWAGIADDDKARRTGERLMADDMFSGWGVRTLASSARSYNPVGYHLGTVWPHDSAIIAVGLRRYGLDDAARRIFDGLVESAMEFEHARLPELFAGFARTEGSGPIRYPVACHPQAWAAGSIPFLLSELLGLQPEGFARRLRIVRPILPSSVDFIELTGVGVAGAAADLRFERRGDGVAVRTLAVRGELEVVVE